MLVPFLLSGLDLFVNGIDSPEINIKIDWVELSKTTEYENYRSLETIRLGDIITSNGKDQILFKNDKRRRKAVSCRYF